MLQSLSGFLIQTIMRAPVAGNMEGGKNEAHFTCLAALLLESFLKYIAPTGKFA